MKYLSNEWQQLQQQSDNFEMCSLLIKLFSVLILLVMLHLGFSLLIGVSILLVLWLQEAIWKTFQARGEARLLQVESLIADASRAENKTKAIPMQLNQQFLQNRPAIFGLLKEYLQQAARPTVIFPHLMLIMIFISSFFIG
ncbi:hypothetical protein AADZ91_08790 [Colwelliaceae bacterium 6441]